MRHRSAEPTPAPHGCWAAAGDLHRYFGLSVTLPGAYYVRLRITIACRLLRDTDEKLDDIARQVGYSGAAHLSRAFKEVMGIRPGEFRRSSA